MACEHHHGGHGVWVNNWREGHSSRTFIKDIHQGHSRTFKIFKDIRDFQGHSRTLAASVLASVLGVSLRVSLRRVSLVRQHRVPLSCVESPNKASSVSH